MGSQDTLLYHEKELRIALSPEDSRRSLPPFPAASGSVLDIGCGMGQTLLASRMSQQSRCVGVDNDLEALKAGLRRLPNTSFVQCNGEVLPFKDAVFDLVIARLSLPYMHIPRALGSMSRVVKPDGAVWLVVHTSRTALCESIDALKARKISNILSVCARVLATVVLYLFRYVLYVPRQGRPISTYQPRGLLVRELRRAGFVCIHADQSYSNAVIAHKTCCSNRDNCRT